MRQPCLALSKAFLAVLIASPVCIRVVAASHEPAQAVSHAGGQVTVITGADKNTVRVRSARFR